MIRLLRAWLTLSFKDRPEKGVGLRNGTTGRWSISQCVEHDEIVDRVIVSRRRDSYPGASQFARVALALVTQHIVLGDNDQRVWKACQLINRCIEWRCGDLPAHGDVRKIGVPERFHRSLGQPRAICEQSVGSA